ncbi:4-amino-4-deoxy-L-arabinose transferase [Rubidibacter lacunae KORDI 51-2]|uniref:4-amino-4-deoxy-L-arabinose transferase n=1 Tax=Rubidibacter lacunae KORDI 51-2 TaxID=582515 RepID=U5DPA3_9CHRO|nr:glycosyltransferase family 39 protein [Rubidibacter lacunae]ERN42667.1 4-amino-4-deoxy-L-arabinose transferase [Rubidibacter lacunae KORDI 51-2]
MKLIEKSDAAWMGWAIAAAWSIPLCGLAFWWQLGSTGLVDETEPLFAEAARQMAATGDWVTPYYNGATRFDKPPLVYWLMALGYSAFGPNAWTTRLPSALSATALTGFGFYVLQRFGSGGAATRLQRWMAAAFGSAAIALNLLMVIWARAGVSDMLLSSCMGGALLSFFVGYASCSRGRNDDAERRGRAWWRPANGWYTACWVLLALAVLTKGPVGIVLPAAVIGTFALFVGDWRAIAAELGVPVGGGLFLLLTVPWFIAVTLANGRAYVESFFGYHNFERFTSEVNGHSAPWYFYFAVLLAGFAPLSAFLPIAIAHVQVWRRRFWQQQVRGDRLGLFAWFWFVCIFLFFSVAVTKLPSYILPLMPAAGILVALWASDRLTQPAGRPARGLLISGAANAVLMLLLAVGIWLGLHLLGYDPSAPELSTLLLQSTIPVVGGTIWVLAAGTIAWVLWQRRWFWLWPANVLAMALFVATVMLPAYQFLDAARQEPLRELAALLVEIAQPGDELWMLGHEKPSLVFYARRPVQFYHRPRHALAAIGRGDHPLPLELLAIGHPKRIADLQAAADRSEIISDRGAYRLARVVFERAP